MQHAISVIPTSDTSDGKPRWRALCACSWTGVRTINRLVAEAQAQQHLSYASEVAAITAAPARAQEGT